VSVRFFVVSTLVTNALVLASFGSNAESSVVVAASDEQARGQHQDPHASHMTGMTISGAVRTTRI